MKMKRQPTKKGYSKNISKNFIAINAYIKKQTNKKISNKQPNFTP